MRLIVLCSIFLILIVKIDRTTSEIHSSMDQLIQLAKSEAQVVEYLRSLLSIQFAKLRDADKILEEFESIAEASNRDPKKFMGNPVNSFLMIKALTIDLNMFFQILNNTQELSATWHQIHYENLLIPTEKDYKETAVALNRIEDTYVLSPEEITKGVFGQSHSIRHLNAFECFELGKISQEKENHYHAVRWFNEALKLVQIEGENRTVNEMLVSGHLTYSIFRQGNVYQAINEANRLLKIEPDNKQLKADLDHYKRRLSDLIMKKLDKNSDLKELKFDDLLVEKKNERRGLSDERKDYESLCRESNDEIYDSSLKCRYINHHPLLRIAPVKQEQVSSDPPIFVFYDVITEYQTEQMIEFSKSKLERATVVGENSTDEISNQRTSQHGWLDDWDLPFLGYLNDLVSAVTNLSLETAEKWQMNNYGLGGHYDVHFDNFQDDSWSVQEVGDRIATWMYYLEAPEMGGATVFPSIGARVSPVNRSAVFWYNLEPSGQRNVRSKHAACPVVVGSKWVANKWIRSHGQIFRRPCDLTQEVYSIRKDSPSQNNATDSNVLDSVLNSVVGSFVNQIIQSYA